MAMDMPLTATASPATATLDRLMARGAAFLGSRYAVMGGAMSWVSERNLVAALSNAGAFGVLANGAMEPDRLAEEIAGTQAIDRDAEPPRLGFTIAKSDLDVARSAIDAVASEKGWRDLRASVETGLAKVSVVGVGMRSYAGVAGRTFRALSAAGVDIHMISTSEIKISCVVEDAAADGAMRALHAEFIK